MNTDGVTNATQAVINSTTTLTGDFNENMVLIKPGPEIKAAGKNIKDFVESECVRINGFAQSMFDIGNKGF